jgi:hypothetical protein
MEGRTMELTADPALEELTGWLTRGDRDKARVMADILYRRYYKEPPDHYREIGRSHGIRAATRVLYLERVALQRLRERATLIQVRLASERVPRRLFVALVGAWDGRGK